MFRAHRVGNGAWWFATTPRGALSGAGGRFGLTEPNGTCYLASTRAAAIRERWGRNLLRGGRVMAADADGTLVSALAAPARLRLADTSSKAADFDVTREISTITPYELPRAWAVALHAIGLAGIRYLPRFSTGVRDAAYALFGTAGERAWPVDPAPESGRAVALEIGLAVDDRPLRVAIARPPV